MSDGDKDSGDGGDEDGSSLPSSPSSYGRGTMWSAFQASFQFNFYNPIKELLFAPPFDRKGNWGREYLAWATQLEAKELRYAHRESVFRTHTHNCYAKPLPCVIIPIFIVTIIKSWW